MAGQPPQVSRLADPPHTETGLISFRLVLGYLVHHGYTSTAVALAGNTGQQLEESQESMTNRQSMYMYMCM